MYNILNFTIMFFQAINQMITAGTDLSINIRRVNSNLTVAVVPRRSGVKDGERIVPLILNGTPEELDAGFLQLSAHLYRKRRASLPTWKRSRSRRNRLSHKAKPPGLLRKKSPKRSARNGKRWKNCLRRRRMP